MTITQEQVRKISKNLAKLHPKNEEKLSQNMTSILDYIDLLNEVDTTWIAPTVSVISKTKNDLRKDIEKREIVPIDLLKCSPQKIIANQIAVSDIMN